MSYNRTHTHHPHLPNITNPPVCRFKWFRRTSAVCRVWHRFKNIYTEQRDIWLLWRRLSQLQSRKPCAIQLIFRILMEHRWSCMAQHSFAHKSPTHRQPTLSPNTYNIYVYVGYHRSAAAGVTFRMPMQKRRCRRFRFGHIYTIEGESKTAPSTFNVAPSSSCWASIQLHDTETAPGHTSCDSSKVLIVLLNFNYLAFISVALYRATAPLENIYSNTLISLLTKSISIGVMRTWMDSSKLVCLK